MVHSMGVPSVQSSFFSWSFFSLSQSPVRAAIQLSMLFKTVKKLVTDCFAGLIIVAVWAIIDDRLVSYTPKVVICLPNGAYLCLKDCTVG